MRAVLVVVLLSFLSACGGNPIWLPRAHKITIQQGNLIDKQQLDRVELGMERDAVRSLIGAPVVSSPFQQNRWDYVYTQGPAGTAIEAKRVSIIFTDDKVASIDSNQDSQSGELPDQRYFWEKRGPRDDQDVF